MSKIAKTGTIFSPALLILLNWSGAYAQTGACCVDFVCVGTMTEEECLARGGIWYEGDDCDAGFECPAPPLDCAEALYDNGPDDFLGVYSAQCDAPNSYMVEAADDFVLGGDANITDISAALAFDSENACGIEGLNGITAVIYNDAGGIPGGNPASDCSHTGDIVWERTYLPGEWVVNDLHGPNRDYQFDLQTGGISLTRGITYWIGFMMHFDLSSCGEGGWAPTTNQIGSVPLLFSDYLGFYWDDPFGYGYDMSFCLHSASRGDCGPYVVGDYNGSGEVNIADVVDMVFRLKTGSPNYPDLDCECPLGSGNVWAVRADVNNSCTFNLTDPIYLFYSLMRWQPLEPCEYCLPGP